MCTFIGASKWPSFNLIFEFFTLCLCACINVFILLVRLNWGETNYEEAAKGQALTRSECFDGLFYFKFVFCICFCCSVKAKEKKK